MSMALTSWFDGGSSSLKYSLVVPPSPEAADTYFSQKHCRHHGEGSQYGPPSASAEKQGNLHSRHSSRSSYSNEDFDDSSAFQAKRTAAACSSDWSEMVYSVGQWTSSAASVVGSTISSTGRQISSTLGSALAPKEDEGYSQGRQVKSFPIPSSGKKSKNTAATAALTSYGRGIDREYLKDSPYHSGITTGTTVVGYLGTLAARFTAPKTDNAKDRWID